MEERKNDFSGLLDIINGRKDFSISIGLSPVACVYLALVTLGAGTLLILISKKLIR